MEKLLKPYDKEFMRMAILKHEETFKEQVYELHRLYHLQKILMKSSIAKMRPKGQKQEMSWINLNNEDGDGNDCDEDGVLEIIDESQIELTLGPTRLKNNRIRKRGGGDQAVLTTDSGGGLSFSSSSTGSSHVMNKTRSFSSNRSGSKHSTSNVVINVGEEQMMRQDERLKLPPWLFQVLSLNMT